MIIYKCDKCGKETKEVYALRGFNNLESVDNPTKGITFHLCEQCSWDVRNFILGELHTAEPESFNLTASKEAEEKRHC